MSKVKRNLISLFLLIISFLILFDKAEAYTIEAEALSGPVFAGLMLHSWISFIILLVSIAIVFVLFRFVRDSELGKPIGLFLLAAILDVFVGAIFSLETNIESMWLIFAVVNVFVLLALIWIAKILGIFALIKNRLKNKNRKTEREEI